MEYRQALESEMEQLAELRWLFMAGEDGRPDAAAKQEFISYFEGFIREEIDAGRWSAFTAVRDDRVVSTMMVQRIRKLPEPGRRTCYIGYLTQVYTLPHERGKGVGARLMETVKAWAREQQLELVIVWPSPRAVLSMSGAVLTAIMKSCNTE